MKGIYTARYIDRTTGKELYIFRSKNPLGVFFWKKDILTKLEETARKHEMNKSNIEIVDESGIF